MTERVDASPSFMDYFRQSRLLKVGLAFNLIYYSGVVIGFVVLLFHGTYLDTVYTVDFRVFYEAGLEFLNSPADIYLVNPNGLPFRYLPSFAIFMALFVGAPMISLYLVNITLMMFCNFGIVYFVYQVSLQRGVTVTTKNFEKTLLFVFIAPQHIINIMFGQITQLAILCSILALFLVQSSTKKSWKHFLLIGLLIGLSTNLKPFFVLLFPFLFPLSMIGRFQFSLPVKQCVGTLAGFLLSMVPNILYFSFYPAALGKLIQVNLFEELAGQHSTSLTKLILAFVPISEFFILKIVLILILGGGIFLRSYTRFVRTPLEKKNYLHHFTDMTFLILLVYPDSWFLFLAVWYAFLAPSMLELYTYHDDNQAMDILWSGSNNLLAFFTIGILLHYLLLGFDPIIPIWLLILYFLYHRLSNSVYSVRKL
ncbi:MAG: hypothetical protein ACFFE7_10700 [Candidatus Thorarchaeota archaeon]